MAITVQNCCLKVADNLTRAGKISIFCVEEGEPFRIGGDRWMYAVTQVSGLCDVLMGVGQQEPKCEDSI